MEDIDFVSCRTFRAERAQWMWKSNSNSSGSSEIEEWNLYSDIEIEIIEEAFQKNQLNISIDDYDIDLKHSLQISKMNKNDQYPIKRCLLNPQQEENNGKPRIRSNRFKPTDSFTVKGPFTNEESEDEFVTDVTHHFNLQNEKYENPGILYMMVEEAAKGLIIEGEIIGKQIEAEWMAQRLQQVTKSSVKDIWKCCARLYTMNSFLYKKINEILRLVGDEDKEHKAIWKSKVHTLGPFVWLLYWLREKGDIGSTIKVYRGATLSEDLIEKFEQVKQNNLYKFPAFTSTTSNRQVAEMYAGNIIFNLEISPEDGNDLSSESQFPDEEEILLVPSFLFKIKSCEKIDNKWNTHLTSFWASSYSTSSSERSTDSS